MAHGGGGYVAPARPRVPPTRAPARATSNLVRSPVPMTLVPPSPQRRQAHARLQRAFVAPPSENLRKYGFLTASAVENAKQQAKQNLLGRQSRAGPMATTYRKPTGPSSEVVPIGTPPRQKPISMTPVPVGRGQAMIRYTYRPPTPKVTPEDVAWHQMTQAIGPDVVRRITNPRIQALTGVANIAAMGVPQLTSAVRQGKWKSAAIQGAFFLPGGKLAEVLPAGEELTRLARSALRAGFIKGEGRNAYATAIRSAIGDKEAAKVMLQQVDASIHETVMKLPLEDRGATAQELYDQARESLTPKVTLAHETPPKEPYDLTPLNPEHGARVDDLNGAQAVYDNARQAVKDAAAKGKTVDGKLTFRYSKWAAEHAQAKKALTVAERGLGEAQNGELYARIRALQSDISPESLAEHPNFDARQTLAENLYNEKSGIQGALSGHMDSPLGIHHVLAIADRLRELGAHGQMWYEQSAEAIKAAAGGDMDKADKLAQLLAIYSPQRSVLTNTGLAFQAYNEYLQNIERGVPWNEAITTGTADQAKKAMNVLAGKGEWEGRKTNNFYVNFLEDINPTKFQELVDKGEIHPHGVTADLWMARAFGYKTDQLAENRYDVIEAITRHIASEHPGWKPKQVQAAIWTAVKDISKDVSGNIDFSTAFERHMAQVNYEAAVGTDPALRAAYDTWSPEVQHAFLQQKSVLVDNFVKDVGLLSGRSEFGPGVWEGEVSPGARIEIGTATSPAGGGYRLPEPDRNLLNAATSAIARGLKQDSAAWVRPFKPKSPGHGDLLLVYIGRTATDEEASALSRELGPDFAIIHAENGLAVKQIGDEPLPVITRKGQSFQTRIAEAAGTVIPDAREVRAYAHDGELATAADYEAHFASAFGDRPGSGRGLRFQQAADRLSSDAGRIDAAYLADPERAARTSAELAQSRRTLHEGGQLLLHDPHGLAHGLPIEPPSPPPVRPPETAPPGVPPPEAPVEAGEPGATGQGVGPMPAELTDLTGQPAAPSDPQTLADMVQEAMRSARYTRARTRSMQSIERGERFNRARQAYVDAGGGIAGHQAMLDELRGELPSLDWGGFKNVDEHSIEAMLRTVYSHSRLRWGEKIRTAEAIIKGSTGEVWTPSEMKLLGRVFPPKAVGSFKQWAEAAKYFAKWGVELFNVPRALMASFDMSAPFRQGLVAGAHNPLIFARNFKTMVKAGMSERYAHEVEQWIRSHPHYQYAVDFRLPLTDHEHGLANTEEQFIGRNLAEKIPLAGHGVKASSRAYESFLNKTRMDLFSKMIDGALAQGLDPYAASRSMLVEHGLTLSNKGDTLGESIARYVGTATGRGTVGNLTDHAATMNALMFSPRLLASRLNLLNPVYYANLDPFARKQALFSMAKLVTAGMSVLGAAKLAGAQVTMNPLNSDFGKIKIGNFRVDIWGGFQQPIRLFAQLIMGMQISPTTGKHMALTASGIGKVSRYDIAMRFLQSKLAPVPSSIVDLSRGQNFAGQPVTAKSLIASHVAPLMLQDMWSMYHPSIPFAGVKGQPASPSRIGAAVGAGVLSGLGVGVASFGAKPTPVPAGNYGGGGYGGGGYGGGSYGGSSGYGR